MKLMCVYPILPLLSNSVITKVTRDQHVAFLSMVDALGYLHRCYGHLPLTRLKAIFENYNKEAGYEVYDLRMFEKLHKYVCTVCM